MLAVIDEDSGEVTFGQIFDTIAGPRGREVHVQMTDADNAIKHIDETYGMETPLFVVGYQLFET